MPKYQSVNIFLLNISTISCYINDDAADKLILVFGIFLGQLG